MKTTFSYLKLFIFILMCISFMFIVKQSNHRDLIENKKEQMYLTIGGLEDMEPYSYFNLYDKYIGYSVDVMDAIAEELGIIVKYKSVNFNNFMEELDNGSIDMVLGLQYDSEYIQKLRYSKPFIKNKFNIFVKYHDNSIRNMDDIRGKKISLYINDPCYQRFRERNDIRVFLCDSEAAAYELLKTGIVDAFIANKDLAMNFVRDPLYKKTLKVVGEDYLVMPSAVATVEEKSHLIDYINKGIDKIIKKGTVEEIYAKWFGQKITEKPEFLYEIIYGVAAVSSFLILVIISIARINNMLKKEVNDRTIDIQKEIKFKEDIMNSLFNSLITLDEDLNITFINNRAKKYKGIDDLNLINKNIRDTDLIEFFYLDDLFDVLKNKEKIINKEKVLRKNDTEIYIEYNVTPLVEEDNVSGITITYKDVTEEKTMRMKIITRDKMESIGRLTAGIAHEIRNPLTSIDMYIKLIPENIEDKEFREQIVEDIPNEITRLNNLITNLLDYAKPKPSKKEVVNLKEEVKFILRLLKNDIDKYEIELINSINDDIYVCFDKQQLKQVIINILINAVEATKHVDNPKIFVNCRQENNQYVIEIINNGKQIDVEIADLIFEPFFSTKDTGCGLGLSMVSQLCKENDADIFVDKNYRFGAKFILIVNQYMNAEKGELYEEYNGCR